MIDPAIWTSDQFMKLSYRQRLIFIGLISNADDEGRLRGEAKKIKALIFPGDEISFEEIENDLIFITQANLIQRWKENGETFIELPKWKDYQNLNYKTASHLPKYSQNALKILSNDFQNPIQQVVVLSSSINKEREERKDPAENQKPSGPVKIPLKLLSKTEIQRIEYRLQKYCGKNNYFPIIQKLVNQTSPNTVLWASAKLERICEHHQKNKPIIVNPKALFLDICHNQAKYLSSQDEQSGNYPSKMDDNSLNSNLLGNILKKALKANE